MCGTSDVCNVLDRLCVQLYPVFVLYVDELIANVLPVVVADDCVSAYRCTVVQRSSRSRGVIYTAGSSSTRRGGTVYDVELNQITTNAGRLLL